MFRKFGKRIKKLRLVSKLKILLGLHEWRKMRDREENKKVKQRHTTGPTQPSLPPGSVNE